MPFQPLANPPSCTIALYGESTVDITSKCSLQIWKASGINLLTQIAPDVWILTTPLAAPVNTMTLICPKKAMETIIIQKTSTHTEATYGLQHHLTKLLPTAPRYEFPTLDVTVSLNMANLHMINILAQDFYIWQHLRSNRNEVQLQHLTTIPSIPVHKIYQHMLNNTPPIIPFDMDEESMEHTDLIWTLFVTYRDVCYSYRITYISRIRLILLLLLLVPTCHISVPDLYTQVTCNIQLWMMM